VLLTRPGLARPRAGLKRILVAVDGSSPSREIAGVVRALVSDTGAEVVLLQVVVPVIVGDPVTGFTPIGVPEPLPDPAPALEEFAQEFIREGISTRALVVTGGASDRILEQARALDADLIAMATAGRKGLSRFMIGSVAEEVVRHMDRPVLLHRIPAKVEVTAKAHGRHAPGAD